MDMQQGLLCKLTHQKAAFEYECPDFSLDESVTEIVSEEATLMENSDLKKALPDEIYQKLKLEQNLPLGLIAGFLAAIIGAVLWGVITVTTEYQIGFMAIAVGAIVGVTIRNVGRGIDQVFGIWGGIISLFGVLLGNYFSIIGFTANYIGAGYFETMALLDIGTVIEVLVEDFDIMTILFLGFAVYEGYRFSFRKITGKDLANE